MKGGEKMEKEKNVPIGVKVISVLYYIGAVFGILLGLLFLVGAGAMGALASQIPLIGALGAGLFIIGAIILLAFGILGIFIGRGLWKAKNWARIVSIIFACLGIILAIVSIISGSIATNLISLIINGFIGWYLLFNSEVKKAFA
jgi:hypothetical protein